MKLRRGWASPGIKPVSSIEERRIVWGNVEIQNSLEALPHKLLKVQQTIRRMNALLVFNSQEDLNIQGLTAIKQGSGKTTLRMLNIILISSAKII